MAKAPKVEQGSYVQHAIAPGWYRLKERFAVDRPDRRVARGIHSVDGLAAGTFITVALRPSRHVVDGIKFEDAEVRYNGYSTIVSGSRPAGQTEISWYAGDGALSRAEVQRLFSALVPDDSDERFITEACHHHGNSYGASQVVLTRLLAGGKVTRADVEGVLAELDAEDESARADAVKAAS